MDGLVTIAGPGFSKAILSDLHPVSAAGIQTLQAIDVNMVMNELDVQWRSKSYGEWANGPIQHIPLRSVPHGDSRGIKLLTYNLWFGSHDDDKTHGFVPYLNRQEHIRAVAAFRMSAHCLNIESMRWLRGARHVQRNYRYCVVIIKFVRMRHTFLSALHMLIYVLSTMTFYLLRSQHKV